MGSTTGRGQNLAIRRLQKDRALLKKIFAVLLVSGLLSIGLPSAAHAGPDRVIRDPRGDGSRNLDLTSVRTKDGAQPTLVVKAAALPRRGTAKIEFYDWENRYELRLFKRRGLTSVLKYVNEETGEKTTFSCEYSTSWAESRIRIVLDRSTCLYEEVGDQYTGFLPIRVTVKSGRAKDVATRAGGA